MRNILAGCAAAPALALATRAYAVNYFFDVNGIGTDRGNPNGGTFDWKGTNWNTASTGTGATVAWADGNFPRFTFTGNNTFTVTWTGTVSCPGMLAQFSAASTINVGQVNNPSGGQLNLGTGVQGIIGTNSTLIFNVPLIGTTTVNPNTGGTVDFYAANTYNGGTNLTTSAVLIGYNNDSAFGTGPITVSNNSTSGVVAMLGTNTNRTGTGTITLANNWVIATAATGQDGINIAPDLAANIPTTCTGTWTLNANLFLKNNGDVNEPLTLSGNITGAGKSIIVGGNNSGTIILSGSNDAWTGGLTIGGGLGGTTGAIVQLGSANALGTTGTISMASNLGTLQFTASNTTDYSPRFSTAGSQTFRLDTNGQTVSLATPITGAATTLTKFGAGTLVLAAANTYTGATTVSGGVMKLGASEVIPNGAGNGNVTVGSGATLDLNTFSETVNGLSGAGSVDTVAGGTPTLTVGDGNASASITGVIKNTLGTLAITKIGTGTQTFGGANTYTGITTVSTGTLRMNNASALGDVGTGTTVNSGAQVMGGAAANFGEPITLNGTGTASNGALQLNSGVETYSGAISLGSTGVRINNTGSGSFLRGGISGANTDLTMGGTGNLTVDTVAMNIGTGMLTKDGSTTLTLSAANTVGPVVVSAGKVSVANAGALGDTASDTNIATGAELLFTGATVNFTVTEPLRIADGGAGDGGAISAIASSTPTLAGTITLTADSTIAVASTSSMTITGDINSTADQSLTLQGGSGAGAGGTISGTLNLGAGRVTKLQGGKWVLNAATGSAYTGGTVVSAGTLSVNNTSGSGTGSGTVSVMSGATLAGTGAIGGNVVLDTGAHIAPGNSIGTETVGTLDLSGAGGAGGTFLDAEIGATSDKIIASNLVLSAGTANTTINLIQQPGMAPGTYTLIDYSAGTLTGNFGSLMTTGPGGGLDATLLNPTGFIRVQLATQTRTWNVDGGGAWAAAQPNNWTPNTSEPNGVGATVNFGSVPPDANTNRGIIIDDANKTAGIINFSGDFAAYTLSTTTGKQIVLDTFSGNAAINITGSAPGHAIAVNLQLNKDLDINDGDLLTLSGAISGAGRNVNISGIGTTEFAGSSSNTYSGQTRISGSGALNLEKTGGATAIVGDIRIDSGATLAIDGSSNQIADTANVDLFGGTLHVTAGVSETMNVLTLDDNSMIDMNPTGPGLAGVVMFADSSVATWAGGKLLSITNWDGQLPDGGGTEQLKFDSSNLSLTAAQLNQIEFVNPSGLPAGTYYAIFSTSNPGEIIPGSLVPEPTSLALLAIASPLLLRRRRT